MIALPNALARWEAELRWLSPELVASLAPMLPRLALALGPLRRSRRDTGEPDGYGRLSRRGPFDRMLASQWALLDELPEDFLRRASSHELLFFELARAEPHGGERSIALFDAGPSSLGTPRLAHLAALVVLARRAAEAGVPFFWGTLREPRLSPFVGEDSVRQLLASRTPFRATDDDLDAWRATLAVDEPPTRGANVPRARASTDARRRAGDDLVVLADAESLALARARLGGSVGGLVVRTELAAARDAITLEVSRAREPLRVVALPLPDGPSCVRLLRDPFPARARPAPTSVRGAEADSETWSAQLDDTPSLADGIVFSRDGRKVIVRARSGRIVVLAAPDTSSGGRVFVRSLADARVLHAVGTAGRRVVQLIEDKRGTLRICELRGGARDLDELALAGIEQLRQPSSLRALALGLTTPASKAPDLVVRTTSGVLIWPRVGTEVAPRVLRAEAVVPIGSGGQGIAIASRIELTSQARVDLGGGYVHERGYRFEHAASIARAPDDSLVVLRRGRPGAAVLERARTLACGPRLPAFEAVLEVRDEGDGTSVLVTELSRGTMLAELLPRWRAHTAEHRTILALTVALGVARALASLEAAGLGPHGGLRPERIRIASDGGVRVAHGLEWQSERTASGQPIEIGYVSPEQIRGLPIDARTDVYALGLVLHEILAGVHPSGEVEPMLRMRAIVEGRLHELDGAGIPPVLHAIVRTATAHAPERRFASVGELARALEEHAARSTIDAREVLALEGLDDEPTVRRAIASPWQVQLLRDAGAEPTSVLRVEAATRAVWGGTAGGDGVLGFVEGGQVRIVLVGRATGGTHVPLPAEGTVVGVCGTSHVVVRRGGSLELRDERGVVAGLAIDTDACVTMAPGWPHVAVLERDGRVRVWSATERRVLLDARGPR
ncbi:MAG: protein kinase [Sandaracinus sp.]